MGIEEVCEATGYLVGFVPPVMENTVKGLTYFAIDLKLVPRAESALWCIGEQGEVGVDGEPDSVAPF